MTLGCGFSLAQGTSAACTGLERTYVVAGTSIGVRNLLNQGALDLVNGESWRGAEFRPLRVGTYDTLQSLAFPIDETDGAYYFGVAIAQGGLSNSASESATVVHTCSEALGETSIADATAFGDAMTGLLEAGGLTLVRHDDFSSRFPDSADEYPPAACQIWLCASTSEEPTETGGTATGPDGLGDIPEEQREPEAMISGAAELWNRSLSDDLINESLPLIVDAGLEVGVIEVAGRRMRAGGGEFLQVAIDVANRSACPLELDLRFTSVGSGTVFGATQVPFSVAEHGRGSQSALVDVTELTSGTLGAEWTGSLLDCEGVDLESADFAEMAFELQGINTSKCELELEWSFLLGSAGSALRTTPVAMRMPDRTVQIYQTTVELGFTAGPLSAGWSGTTIRCPDGLDQSFYGSIELWDLEPSDSANTRAEITSYAGETLGFVYVIPKITAETTGVGTRREDEGPASTGQPTEAHSVEFDPIEVRSRWGRSTPYVPES